MANSYRKIDYRLRPAKAVERRLMVEYLLRLHAFQPLDQYQYVGMGSVYFSDFSLFHSTCGFHSMVSIEDTSDPTIKDRFHFNRPFGNVELQFGNSTTVLPKLNWDSRTILWLDYDGPLTMSVLRDVELVPAKVKSGSMFFVSINADLKDEEEAAKSRLDILSERVGPERIPARYQGAKNLPVKEVPAVFHEILNNEVKSALAMRNAGVAPDGQLIGQQVFFMTYKDDAEMLTLGWVFYGKEDRMFHERCAFHMLPHYRADSTPFRIEIPRITNAEVRELNRRRFVGGKPEKPELPLPPSEVEKYLALRRFWPVFSIPEIT
ncbi:O-methyltransferase [Cupriavidus taiwanensis]|uniref:O-methyltransferase n=1 Tax=Cupriavidus taiwanensis TaxID=164546 RepID=UPI0011C035FE|nr:O-methyltransferase [Cupriavidus taiwanensis]